MAKAAGSKFWILGAAYWIAIAAALGIAHYFWPHLSEKVPFVLAVVLGAMVGGFAIVYLFRPK